MIAAQSFDADERALADVIATACGERPVGAPFDRAAWRVLAELGVFSLGSDGPSPARGLVAVFEALGELAHAGPLVETVIAMALLEGGPERAAIERGETLACVGAVPFWPFATGAQKGFAIVGEAIHPVRLTGAAVPVTTLAGDPWIESAAELEAPLAEGGRALALGRLAAAAALVGAGRILIERAAERARTRQQFGRPIGAHQSVSHPLADCTIRLSASEGLLRTVALELDARSAEVGQRTAMAFASARASALSAAYQAHQTFGALGITVEGPLFAISRRVRQWASLPIGLPALEAVR